MERYQVDTMSRRELRGCYNRYAWAVLLLYPLSKCTILAILMLERWLLPGQILDPAWMTLRNSLINAFASYVPPTLLFLVLLRRFPRSEKLPVDRLGLWEFLFTMMLTLGLCYLLNLTTLGLIALMEKGVGMSALNRVAQQDNSTPLWNQVVFMVLLPPVCEELLFRRLLLDRLRVLGDVSAIVLSALAFALYHMNLFQMLYAFGLGMLFAVVVLLTGSIRDTILLHMCVNGMTVLNNALGSEFFSLLYTLFLCLSAAVAVVFLATRRGSFQLEGGPLRLSARDKRRACLRSGWFWLMLLNGVLGSGVLIFR